MIDGGFWSILTLVLGVVALVVSMMAAARAEGRSRGLASWLTFATVLVGLAGMTMALYQGGQALTATEAETVTVTQLTQMLSLATAPAFKGAGLGALCSVLLGVAAFRTQE